MRKRKKNHQKTMKKILKPGLYVHIPFCNCICPYCSFTKVFYDQDFADRYLTYLEKELTKYSNFLFKSIYIGGGTPTSLSHAQLERLFLILKKYQSKNYFITIESNPELTEDKIEVLEKYNVKRISIGVQTFNQTFQKQINRFTTPEEISSLINRLHKHGISDINLDLIYGFNHETIDDVIGDLKIFTSFDIKHISTYCLQVEEMSIFYNKKYPAPDQDEARKQYDAICDYLKIKGFYRYEVSNFAKKGFQSRHNLIYWNDQEYGGVGLGASSYINRIRRTSTKSLSSYLKGKYDDYVEPVDDKSDKFYFIMLGLRLEQGFALDEYQRRFKTNFLDEYHDKISPLLDDGNLVIKDGYIALREDDLYIADYFLRKILF